MASLVFEASIGFVLIGFVLFFLLGSFVVHLGIGLVNVIAIRFDKKPVNETLSVFFYLALHIYLFAVLRSILATSEKEWVLFFMVGSSFVLFMVSKELFANGTAYLLIKIFRVFKSGDVVKIGSKTGEVGKTNIIFSIIKIHPGKEISITNKNILKQVIHNYSYDNLQRHTINFQIRNTDDFKEIKNGILIRISANPSLTRSPKPRFHLNQMNDENSMATLYFWSSIANSRIIYQRIFEIIKASISTNNKRPRFFSRDYEIIKN